MSWLVIASRNLLRNRRRSAYTILAIALGFAAINVFGGFTHYVFSSLMDGYIYAEARGHLSVFKNGYAEHGRSDPARYLLSVEQQEKIRVLLKQVPGFLVASPILNVQGLLSNGDVSVVFLAAGHIPSVKERIRERAPEFIARLSLFEDRPLRDDLPHGIRVAPGLARTLGLKTGSTAIAMSPTVDGQVNALDAEVFGRMMTPNLMLDNKLIDVGLSFAQSLYDTQGVERFDVLLDRESDIESFRKHFRALAEKSGLDFEVWTWREQSPFYVKVERMFEIIFLFIFLIVLVIVVMSVVNTITMAILERTREIGTLRAIGFKKYHVVGLFATESMLLGLIGGTLGAFIQLAAVWLVSALELTWIPPHLTREIPLQVHVVPAYMVSAFILLGVTSFIAAIMPSTRMARTNIVEALGHV